VAISRIAGPVLEREPGISLIATTQITNSEGLNEDDGFHSVVVRDIMESGENKNKWTLTARKGSK